MHPTEVRKKKTKGDEEDTIQLKGESGREYSVLKGKPQKKGEKPKEFESNEILVASNLFHPRQKLACESQSFLVETMTNLETTSTPLPFSIVSELTGLASVSDRKYVQIDFHMDFSANCFPQSNVDLGFSPVKTIVSLRKALFRVNNQTALFLNYDEFMKVVTEGRSLLQFARTMLRKKIHPSQLIPPEDILIREETGSKGTTIVILRMTFERNEFSDSVIPVIHVREFFEDIKNQIFRPGMRGLTFGLRAFHSIIFPITATMHNLQESLIRVKTSADEFKHKAMQVVEKLEAINQWEEDEETDDPTSFTDDLAKLENDQQEAEKRMVAQFCERGSGEDGEEQEEDDEQESSDDEKTTTAEIDLRIE
jgi:hypothetical protein